MKKMKNALLGAALVLAPVAAMAQTTPPANTFGFDSTAISADVLVVGALMVGIATVFLGYKLVRRLIAR